MLILALVVVGFFLLFQLLGGFFFKKTTQEVNYDQFIKMLSNEKVEEVLVRRDRLIITPKTQTIPGVKIRYYTPNLADYKLVERLEESGVSFKGENPSYFNSFIGDMLSLLFPLIILYLILGYAFRRMGAGSRLMGMGGNKAKLYKETDTKVTFKDVAGQEEAKESLVEVVDFLHNPAKYAAIGAKLPKGALLVGPPGTGKTLLAKAVAGEAKCPFFSLSGSEFVELFVGMGASRVRELFVEAKKNAPCIIFIDEIDAIGKTRDTQYGGNDEREQTLNQLLAEMDGFDSESGLLIIGATNRPEVLDKALLRPGRFDRRVVVEKPDVKGRIDVLKVHGKKVNLDDTVDFEEIALATSGAVGADLANMINEAAILAVKEGRNAVSQKDLVASVELVLVGKEKKEKILSQEERRLVSYHEVGHALIMAVQKDSEPIKKITIVPRTMGALGYVLQVPEDEKYLYTKKELEAMLVHTLGGRAAEEVVFDTVTTGAANDIEQVTRIARAMVTQYGMSSRFGLMGLEKVQNQYLDGRTVMDCGDATATAVDEEVMIILKNAYKEAKDILRAHRKALDEIANYLYEKETITGKEFMRIFREIEGSSEGSAKQERFGFNEDHEQARIQRAEQERLEAEADVGKVEEDIKESDER